MGKGVREGKGYIPLCHLKENLGERGFWTWEMLHSWLPSGVNGAY